MEGRKKSGEAAREGQREKGRGKRSFRGHQGKESPLSHLYLTDGWARCVFYCCFASTMLPRLTPSIPGTDGEGVYLSPFLGLSCFVLGPLSLSLFLSAAIAGSATRDLGVFLECHLRCTSRMTGRPSSLTFCCGTRVLCSSGPAGQRRVILLTACLFRTRWHLLCNEFYIERVKWPARFSNVKAQPKKCTLSAVLFNT